MFDLHCDTLIKIKNEQTLHHNIFDVSFEKLASYQKSGQVFAIFNSGSLTFSDILDLIGTLKKEVQRSPLATFCTGAHDFDLCAQKVGAFVSIEALGNTSDLSLEHIDILCRAGVRIISLTWNNDNMLCGGIGQNSSGLTIFGRSVIQKINALNMVLDVSHISDCGFFEASEVDGLKIIATHSNSRAVCSNNRNLTDEEFIILKDRCSVVGLNTYPLFVNGTNNASVCDLVSHIEHFCSLGGEKCICLGADFDGIDVKMRDIDSCDKMYILFDYLAKLNYKDEQIEAIAYRNFLDFLKRENI